MKKSPCYKINESTSLCRRGMSKIKAYSVLNKFLLITSIVVIALFVFACDDFLEKDISDSAISYLNPTSGWETENSEVKFSWETIEGATDYKLMLVSPSFDKVHELIVDSTLTDNILILDLSPGLYEWKVCGQNTVSSSEYTFGDFEILPLYDISTQQIVINNPENDQIINESSIEFDWSKIEGASYYDILIKRGSWTAETFHEEKAYSNSYSLVLEDGVYVCGIAAVDTINKKRTDYALCNITVNKNVPIAPIPANPANNDTIRNNVIQFCWSHPEKEQNFRIELFTDVDLFNLVESKESNDTTVFIELENSGQYFWRLKATDSYGHSSGFSSVSTFFLKFDVTADIHNEIVVLRSPISSEHITTKNISFWWDEIDGATNYTLQVVSPNFEQASQLIINKTTEVTFHDYELEEGDYEWRVKASNAKYSTEFSTGVFKINTTSISHESVTLNSPYNGFITTSKNITFWWEELANAEEYVIQLVKPNFTSIEELIEETTISNNQFTVTLPKGSYQWRVKAKNSTSETGYSSPFSITINDEE